MSTVQRLPEQPRECSRDERGRCRSFYPGHNLHVIHANHVGRTPWGWRDGVVRELASGWLHIDYVADPAEVRVWHHEGFPRLLRPGTPVRLHEQYHALGSHAGWLNVVVVDGCGPVPAPPEPGVWATDMTVGVVDLSTGRGVAMDHERGGAGPG